MPGDSLASFIARRITKNPGRLLIAVALAPFALLMLVGSIRTFSGSIFIWLATVGLSPRRFVRLVKKHVVFHLLPRANHRLLTTLREHLRAGDAVVVATGSLTMIARHFLRQANVHGVRVVGSRLRWWCAGLVARHHCYGEAKVARISVVTRREQWDLLYTDSKADLPIMLRAGAVWLVRPSKRTIRVVSQLIGEGRVFILTRGLEGA